MGFENTIITDFHHIQDFLYDYGITYDGLVEEYKHKETDTRIQYWFDA